ncbi:MAG: lytic transglycosylase domain-containing protein [Muribaculaceae bacterium]|nr:lytic transglycosylase domain-containing protein [Muribaculaceae bacterium]
MYKFSRGACAAAMLLFLSCASAEALPAPDGNSPFSNVINPKVPSRMTLAGEVIDLDPVDRFERLDRELTSMAYTHGNTLLIIKRANRYFPEMAPILRKNGVPEDLLYLACIESMLNDRALSPAKAGGIWQFMPTTAKQYGLEVSDEVDERYNLELATAAACRYLKNAKSRYGNWISAMASYNAGPARISKELEAQNADLSLDLYLTDETTRYVYRIMAMKAIMENPAAFGFNLDEDQLYQPRQCKEVTVSGPVEDWPQWAAEHGITYAQLRDVNPWIRAKKLTNKTGKTYTVKIPEKKSLRRSTQHKNVYNRAWVD